MKKSNILFLGCGKMGAIIASNLLESKLLQPASIKVIKPTDRNKIPQISYLKSAADLPKNYCANLVFICVKPQDANEILSEFSAAKIFDENTIFVSILAGKKVQFFTKFFGKKAKIIRAMPNLPIQYSQGIFPFFAGKNFDDFELLELQKIFNQFGSSFLLKDEKYFDEITAIFGSGPAYIFLLEEIFCEIAQEFCAKANADQSASDLVKKLFLGSALMAYNSNSNLSELRNFVTSKGGTTQAALDVLMKNSALKKLFGKAILAAKKRSKFLGLSEDSRAKTRKTSIKLPKK